MSNSLIITCEHGGANIPTAYADLYRGWHHLLQSHRGLDLGALDLAGDLSVAFGAPLIASTVSRLLIDLNRSLWNPAVWSDATRHLPEDTKDTIIRQHYTPHRSRVYAAIQAEVTKGNRAIHVACHSFTPVLNGSTRTADVGLLYDPAREEERHFAKQWQRQFRSGNSAWRVRRNYPYAGWNDGLTSLLRQHFNDDAYVGIELEINQALVTDGAERWRATRDLVADTLRATLAETMAPMPGSQGLPHTRKSRENSTWL